MLNLRQIEAFRALMLTGTTIQAAAMLRITQPVVSRLIASLEAQAGITLFARAQGRLRPTPEAEILFDEIERAYVSFDQLANFIKDIRRTAGTLRLLATMPMAHGILPEAITRFREVHPETIVKVRTVLRRDVRAWLDAQQFDVALTNFPLDYPAGSTLQLASVDGVCILPVGHPLVAKDAISAADLVDEPFIAMAAESQHRLKVDSAFEVEGLRPRIAIEAQTSILIAEFVAAGLGVSVVDPIAVRAYATRGIVSRPFHPKLTYEFRLLFPVQKARSRAVRQFSDIAVALVRELGFAG